MSRKAASEAEDRLLGIIGLAVRAGRVKVGYDAVRDSVKRGEAVAVIVAGDAPTQVKRKLDRMLEARSTPRATVPDGDRLGHAIGRKRTVALAITDGSLGRRVIELTEEQQA